MLLLQNDQGLVERRIALLDLLPQDCNLRRLATQAEDRGSRHIGMIDVTGDQSAEIVGILARSTASPLMQQKFDAVDVLKETWDRRSTIPRLLDVRRTFSFR